MKFQLHEKKLKFNLDVENSVPKVILSDQKRLKQVLFNLIGNAVKFTFSGSISLNLNFDLISRLLKVQVIDTGLGIKKEDLTKLFKFFGKISSTSDINRGGMGLGLTISKMIVEQLGGDI